MIQNQRFTSNPEDAAMDIENSITIRRAKLTDREELLALYLTVYGDDYPLELGTNKQLMTRLLEEQEKAFWFVVELADRPGIAASCVVELEPEFRIGKVTGAAVHPQCAGLGLSSKLIGFAVNEVMAKAPSINTLYATTRTVTMASQKCLFQMVLNHLEFSQMLEKLNIKTSKKLILMQKITELFL